jgi:hypothetical protein
MSRSSSLFANFGVALSMELHCFQGRVQKGSEAVDASDWDIMTDWYAIPEKDRLAVVHDVQSLFSELCCRI